jgi:predicted transcriptional regulator
MARKHDAAEFLTRGYSIPEIAEEMRVTPSTIKQYLCTLLGEGKIRPSDILFSISPANRAAIRKAARDNRGCEIWEIQKKLKNQGCAISREEIEVFVSLEDKALGDMYDYIREIELTLHFIVKLVLCKEFKKDWWNKGIPVVIRKECASRKEEDVEPNEWEHGESEQGEGLLPDEDKYRYTTFINLSTIIDKQWNIFIRAFPNLVSDKKKLCRDIEKLNRIRNKVMHPIKRPIFAESDFSFVHDFHKEILANELKNARLVF